MLWTCRHGISGTAFLCCYLLLPTVFSLPLPPCPLSSHSLHPLVSHPLILTLSPFLPPSLSPLSLLFLFLPRSPSSHSLSPSFPPSLSSPPPSSDPSHAPDALEVIFQAALAAGRAGAVGQRQRTDASMHAQTHTRAHASALLREQDAVLVNMLMNSRGASSLHRMCVRGCISSACDCVHVSLAQSYSPSPSLVLFLST